MAALERLPRSDSSEPAASVVATGFLQDEVHSLRNTTIVLMRHGEKPDDNNNPNLSPAGEARANALTTYIPSHYGNPDFLFAAADSKDSSRPVETLQPLSNATGVPIDAKIADKDYLALVNELNSDPAKYDGKTIVIDWHHGEIPKLAKALGAPDLPLTRRWPDNDFDDTLVFHFDANGTPTVTKVPENLSLQVPK
jgi:hypothetical protein